MPRFALALALTALLAVASLFVGVGEVTPRALLWPAPGQDALQLLLVSRIPRTLSIVLAGAALGVAGLVMQLLARNRFVEPSTAGTAEAASLGLLAAMVLTPEMPILGKMLLASGFALAGTALFLGLLRRIPLRSVLVVPLMGLMLGAVIDSVTTFLAYRFDMLQSVNAWTAGDFSGVLEGRYELLWVALLLTLAAYAVADRLTLAGMGEAFTTNLGVNHARILALGLGIVAMVTAAVVVTVGMIPFLGLVVPNLVSMFMGDHARRSIPWIAVAGAAFLLACDLLGRLLLYPYEIPVGTVAGVIGAALFLHLLFRRDARLA
ncbi:ABC transporter permease [Roseococcus suduntuyensis]|uniref:Iron complex transport system permease protein n=1 Tax=Roseococcus suduntuyensis TaxID=455361 RepID=A0A840AJY0_9PROT|nr:iron chelate uptake ABC transporter family permease subunit [Roseococcus suduntuyensis]MBB3900325.1 iron complex transport system permease protein [Roseococcus suduntuyensis]